MNFNEFAEKHFAGNEEHALESLAREEFKAFNLISGYGEWFKIIDSLSDEQSKRFKMLSREYRESHKDKLDLDKILKCEVEYKRKRKGMVFLAVFSIVFWYFVLLGCGAENTWLFPIPSIITVIFLCVWIYKKSSDMRDLHKGKFYIKKAAVNYKHIEKHDDSESFCSHCYYICFPEYDEYMVTEQEYCSIEYGDEYFLIILNKNNKKIVNIFYANAHELSDEFCLLGDKYVINKSQGMF